VNGASTTTKQRQTLSVQNESSALATIPAKQEEDLFQARYNIDFGAPKWKPPPSVDIEFFASVLDAELYEREWFVTGYVNPIYFDDERFVFQDPDVTLNGIEEYARGVFKLFDQKTSQADILSTQVNYDVPDTITCTWRLSGKVNLGPAGISIKPYIVYTDFFIDTDTMLIVRQEDRFSLPQWDILLSAFFPFLNGIVTAKPAPPAEPRIVHMPKFPTRRKSAKPFGSLFQIFTSK
jgi:hypothetical protein